MKKAKKAVVVSVMWAAGLAVLCLAVGLAPEVAGIVGAVAWAAGMGLQGESPM